MATMPVLKAEATVEVVVDVDVETLATVKCPRCKYVLGQNSLAPDSWHKYRCRRCQDWTVLAVVGVPVPTSADAN